MIILDTNVISELMKGNQCSENVFNWTSRQRITNLFTTTITQAEILYGISILLNFLSSRRTQVKIVLSLLERKNYDPIIL